MLSKLMLAGAGIAAAITLAPTANADSDYLTNSDIAGSPAATQEFERFDTGIEPVLGTGGQGPFDHIITVDPDGNGPLPRTKRQRFDNGLA